MGISNVRGVWLLRCDGVLEMEDVQGEAVGRKNILAFDPIQTHERLFWGGGNRIRASIGLWLPP